MSVCGGNFDPIRRLIENESASEWARSAAIEALVIAGARGLLPPDGVERELEQLMSKRLKRRPSFVWSALAGATGDLASSLLLPEIERAYHEGLVDEFNVTLREIRADVRLGRDRALAAYRRSDKDGLIEDVIKATRWWSFFSEQLPSRRQVSTPPSEARAVMQRGVKIGRNDPCPCGSGKKYKKCCEG